MGGEDETADREEEPADLGEHVVVVEGERDATPRRDVPECEQQSAASCEIGTGVWSCGHGVLNVSLLDEAHDFYSRLRLHHDSTPTP